MVTTESLTGARKPDQSDGPLGGAQIANAIQDLSGFTVPRFTSTGDRDTKYAAWVTAGGTMADGMQCTVSGVPYRRISGTWRIDRNRNIKRTTTPTSVISSGGANQTGLSGPPALATFVLYEACTVQVTATFRAGRAGSIATCKMLIDGAQVGESGLTRADSTCSMVGTVALAAGTHTPALRVEASGDIDWSTGTIVISEGIAE